MTRRIASPDNPTIKRFRALANDARKRSAEGRTVIEGEHLVRAWLDHGMAPELCLVDEDRAISADLRTCIDRLQIAGTEIITVPSRLLKLTGTIDSPAPMVGIVACRAGSPVACQGKDCVILDAVQDPGNVGTIMRTAAAAGVGHVILGPGTASAWSPKVLRAAMGAHPVLNIVEGCAIAELAGRLGVPLLGTDGHASAVVHDIELSQSVAWVFGNEGQGLSETVRQSVSQFVAIPQIDTVESLNVASAAAICLFEMRRQRRAPSHMSPN